MSGDIEDKKDGPTDGSKDGSEGKVEIVVPSKQDRAPDHYRRGGIAAGLVLVLFGAFLLAVQWLPGFNLWISWEISWPLIVVGAGVLLAVIGLVTLESDMAIPAVIVGGIGGLLYYQNTTGDWASWAYAWALIPGFVGVGMILAGLFRGLAGRRTRNMLVEGLSQIVTSVVLFAIFGSFLGGPQWLGRYWPLAIILLGVWIVVRPRRWKRR
jgi:hypothetical protein